jgi:hypothetical protein
LDKNSLEPTRHFGVIDADSPPPIPMNHRLVRLAFLVPLLVLPLIAADNPAPAPAAPAAPAAPEPAKPNWDWLTALLPKTFQANPELEMTVITEMTDEGRKLPPVTPDHPAYYDAESGGDHEMGELNAREEKLPPEDVRPLLIRGLALNGYRPAERPVHPPSLLIIYIWGTHNAITANDGQGNTTASPDEVLRNVLDRAALVGGKKFADELTTVIQDTQNLRDSGMAGSFPPPVNIFKMQHANNESLLNQALADVYFVVASAFDYQSVVTGHPTLLWRTRMTVSSQGVAIRQAIPTVVASGARYFGREMSDSAIINRRPISGGKVEIGTPTVVEPTEETKK